MMQVARLALVVAAVLAGQAARADCTRHTVEDSGFSSLAFITTDAEWQDVAVAEGPGELGCTDGLKVGETGILVVLFSGAGVTEGHFAVDCDYVVTGPGGEETVQDRQPCAHFVLNGQPADGVYMTVMQVGIRPEQGEAGESYTITYGLTDGTSGTRIVHDIAVPVEAGS